MSKALSLDPRARATLQAAPANVSDNPYCAPTAQDPLTRVKGLTPYAPMVQCAHASAGVRFAARWPPCGDLWSTGEHVCASHTLPAKASSMASIQGLFAFLIHRRFGRGCTLNADVLRDVCSGAYAPWAVGCGFSMMIQAMAGGRRAARPMGGPACHASADSRYQAAPEHGERPEAPGTRCGHDIVLIERWHGGILA